MCIIMKIMTHVHEYHVSERQDIIIIIMKTKVRLMFMRIIMKTKVRLMFMRIIMKTIKDEDSCSCASRN